MSFIIDSVMWLLAAICFSSSAYFVFKVPQCRASLLRVLYMNWLEHLQDLDMKYKEAVVREVDNNLCHYQIFQLEDPYYYSLQLSHVPAYAEFNWTFHAGTVVMVENYYTLQSSGEFIPFELSAWRCAEAMNMSLSTFLWLFEDGEMPAWLSANFYHFQIAPLAKRDFLMDFYAR